MKIILLLLVAALMSIHSLQAQDLIVTTKGDSINCKITLKTMENMRFRFKRDDIIQSVTMPRTEIADFRYDYFPGTVLPEVVKIKYNDYPHLRVAVTGGLSKEIAEIADGLSIQERQMYKDLSSGINIGGDIHYYLSEDFGLGAKYVSYHSSASSGYSNSFTNSNDVGLTIQFVGPSASARLLHANKKNALIFNMAIGYVGYKMSLANGYMKGSNVAIVYDLGYDISFSEKMSLGFQLSYLSGYLTQADIYSGGRKVDTIKMEKGSYESLHRLDFSVGLRYNL
jgi:hypothetical protein